MYNNKYDIFVWLSFKYVYMTCWIGLALDLFYNYYYYYCFYKCVDAFTFKVFTDGLIDDMASNNI